MSAVLSTRPTFRQRLVASRFAATTLIAGLFGIAFVTVEAIGAVHVRAVFPYMLEDGGDVVLGGCSAARTAHYLGDSATPPSRQDVHITQDDDKRTGRWLGDPFSTIGLLVNGLPALRWIEKSTLNIVLLRMRKNLPISIAIYKRRT
jgi:hypothetical protein